MGIGSVCPCERSVRAVTGAFGDACPGLPCPDLAWYAIYTQTSRERMARDQIRQLDIEAFLPSYTRLSRWGVRGDVVKVEAPLFPGYMFARFDAASDLGLVKRAGGVSQVIGPGSRPLRVGDEIVETLRRASPEQFARLARAVRSVSRRRARDGGARAVRRAFGRRRPAHEKPHAHRRHDRDFAARVRGRSGGGRAAAGLLNLWLTRP